MPAFGKFKQTPSGYRHSPMNEELVIVHVVDWCNVLPGSEYICLYEPGVFTNVFDRKSFNAAKPLVHLWFQIRQRLTGPRLTNMDSRNRAARGSGATHCSTLLFSSICQTSTVSLDSYQQHPRNESVRRRRFLAIVPLRVHGIWTPVAAKLLPPRDCVVQISLGPSRTLHTLLMCCRTSDRDSRS